MQEAVSVAQKAFESWRETPITARTRIMFNFQQLIQKETDNIARMIVEEQGKTFADAKGDVFRGLGIIEFFFGFIFIFLQRL